MSRESLPLLSRGHPYPWTQRCPPSSPSPSGGVGHTDLPGAWGNSEEWSPAGWWPFVGSGKHSGCLLMGDTGGCQSSLEQVAPHRGRALGGPVCGGRQLCSAREFCLRSSVSGEPLGPPSLTPHLCSGDGSRACLVFHELGTRGPRSHGGCSFFSTPPSVWCSPFSARAALGLGLFQFSRRRRGGNGEKAGESQR